MVSPPSPSTSNSTLYSNCNSDNSEIPLESNFSILTSLPPSTNNFENDDNVPDVLLDRVLGLHSKRPGLNRNDSSLIDILSNNHHSHNNKHRKNVGDENEPLINSNGESGNDLESDDESDEEGDNLNRIRSERSRSKSRSRKLPWHKRPSPLWFLPSTLFMSISIGLIIAPKLEIYTQLMCRSIGQERSGTTLPAPSTSIFDDDALGASHRRPNKAIGEIGLGTEVNDFVDNAVNSWVEGDTWSKQCRKSPAVQESVTRLVTILTLLMGILSAMTAGYWGALSDRKGRKPILALALFGTIFMDAVFLIVVNYHDVVGYRFLLIGPALDGLLGGMSTAQAAVNAYLSDCTEAGSRARIFSILGGLLFAGIAVGPTLGALSIKLSGSVMCPFYVALALHSIYFLSVIFIFPESLSTARQLDASRRHIEENEDRVEKERKEDELAKEGGEVLVWFNRFKRALGRVFGFLKPLALLLPRKRGEGEKEEDRPVLESRGPVISGWDFELTKVATAYATYVLVVAIMGPKILYASYKYGWGPEENGYYLSFLGCCRVFALIVAVPILIKIFRKPPPLPSTPRPENRKRLTGNGTFTLVGDRNLTKAQKEWENEAKYLRVVHDSHFDLFLARSSIIVDILTYSLISQNHGSPLIFLAGSGLSSFGAATTSALQSLALALASPRDSGRLFASLSVLQSISSQVIGPILFAGVYISTVSWFPELMFYLATLIFILSFTITMSISLKRKIIDGEAEIAGIPEDLIDNGIIVSMRGRSQTRKVNNTSAGEGEF